jgi:hypothetical protein
MSPVKAPGWGETAASAAPARPSGQQRNTWRHPLMWTLQGWLTMFYLAAGYAKLTAPRDHLVLLLHWPEVVSPRLPPAVGLVEILLALALIAPLVSWRLFERVMIVSATVIGVYAVGMAVVHAFVQVELTVVNLIAAALAAVLVHGRGCGFR